MSYFAHLVASRDGFACGFNRIRAKADHSHSHRAHELTANPLILMADAA